MPSLSDHIFLAVFDGHGGIGAATFAEKHLVTVLEDSMQWKLYYNDENKSPKYLGEALVAAFVELDKLLRLHQQSLDGADTSGCTAITCMICPKHFVCANIGDSRCVLGSDCQTFPLSVDHKPCDEEEERRVVDAGGRVNR